MGLPEPIELNLERIQRVQANLDTFTAQLKRNIPGLHPLEIATALEQAATAIRYEETQKRQHLD